MELRFYAWFLAELIAALRALDLQQRAQRHLVMRPGVAGQMTLYEGESLFTGRQSNLLPRPGQRMVVLDKQHALGDTNRHRQFLDPLQGAFVIVAPPWTIPPPMAPLLSLSCGVSWDAAQPAGGPFDPAYRLPGWPSFPGLEAEDHHIETVYERESFAELSGEATDADYPPVEVTGVYVQPDWQRPRQEAYPRLDHLAYRRRPSLRFPYMAGVDGDGHYLRVVIVPMKTCREDTSFIPV